MNLIVIVDGVFLCKSVSAQFWPIFCRFQKLPPFTVAIYYGNRKSSNVEDFLLEVFTEYINLQNDNIEFRGVRFLNFFHLFVMLQLDNFGSFLRAIMDTGVVNDLKFKVLYESALMFFTSLTASHLLIYLTTMVMLENIKFNVVV